MLRRASVITKVNGAMITDNLPRHRQLRVRAFAARVQIKDIAEATGYHYQYVSQLLRGKAESEPGLRNIEKAIEDLSRRKEAA